MRGLWPTVLWITLFITLVIGSIGYVVYLGTRPSVDFLASVAR